MQGLLEKDDVVRGKAGKVGKLGKSKEHGKSGKTKGGVPEALFRLIPWLQEAVPAKVGLRVPRVTVVDAGAMDIGEPPVYQSLVEAGVADVVGFEPIEEECAKLNKHVFAREDVHVRATARFLPVALGVGDSGEFRQCSSAMTSSFLEPNLKLLSRFHQLEEVTTVVRRSEMTTQRLDDLLSELPGERADFMKLDVQGYELEVLRGAEKALRSALVVHTEVEFVEMYKGQALFADVDTHLRARGFVFHRFYGVKGLPSRQMALPVAEPPYSQQLWADAVYVRGLWSGEELRALEPDALLRLALILHEVYLSYDAAHFVLEAYNPDLAGRYRDMIMGPPRVERPTLAVLPVDRSGRRQDPTDGRIYTFLELLEKCSAEHDERDLEMYWQESMRPVPTANSTKMAEAASSSHTNTAREGEWDLLD